MKCLAAGVGGYDTSGDAEDVLALCRHLKLTDAGPILEIAGQFYPDTGIPVKTRYFVQELSPPRPTTLDSHEPVRANHG